MVLAMGGFWTQPGRRYRNFQIVYTILTLNFIIPSFSYAFSPMTAIQQFFEIGHFLSPFFGVDRYPIIEESYVWRCLAVGNVFTLGFMCLMLQIDLPKHFPILWPLVIMKSIASFGYLKIFLSKYPYPAFFAIFVFDAVTVLAMLYFAIRARRELERLGVEKAVPQPHSVRSLRKAPTA